METIHRKNCICRALWVCGTFLGVTLVVTMIAGLIMYNVEGANEIMLNAGYHLINIAIACGSILFAGAMLTWILSCLCQCGIME